MHLQQWLDQRIKLNNNNHSNYGINLIEINKYGKLRYFQPIIINDWDIYKANNLLDLYNIYFLRFFQYYFVFFANIQNYQFEIIQFHKNGYSKSHRSSISTNDINFGEYYLLDYFTLDDMIKIISLAYNSFFNFQETIDIFGNDIYKEDLPNINYMNQINYFLTQFIYSLYKYADNNKFNFIKPVINFEEYIKQNFYFFKTEYKHCIIDYNNNKYYTVYSNKNLQLWNIKYISDKFIENIPKHFYKKYNNLHIIYSLDTDNIYIVKLLIKKVLYIISGKYNQLTEFEIKSQIYFAYLCNKLSYIEFKDLLNNYSQIIDIPYQLLYKLIE